MIDCTVRTATTLVAVDGWPEDGPRSLEEAVLVVMHEMFAK